MVKPKVALGGIVTACELGKGSWNLIIKQLRRVYTDAIPDDLSIPDMDVFQDAIREADLLTKAHPPDGFDVARIVSESGVSVR